jgi:hypothetical protein
MRDAVCRSVGLPAYAIGPSSWERFVEGAQASSALHSHAFEIRSRYARLGECTRSKGKAKQAIAAAKTSAGQSSSRMRWTAVRACICHSVGAVCFLRVAVSLSFLWRVFWEYMN